MDNNINISLKHKKRRSSVSGPRFNVFDFLIILAIVICVGAIIARAAFVGGFKKEFTRARIVFEVSGVSSVTADALSISYQSLYLQSDDTWIGTVIAASQSPQKVFEKDTDGVLQAASHPEKKTVRIEAFVRGMWTEDGFLIVGEDIATVGNTFNVYTPYASCTVTVIGITESQ